MTVVGEKQFPFRHRPLEHTGDNRPSIANGQRGKGEELVKEIRNLAQREMGKRPCTVEGEHAGADTSNGIGNLFEMTAGEGSGQRIRSSLHEREYRAG